MKSSHHTTEQIIKILPGFIRLLLTKTAHYEDLNPEPVV